MNASPDPDVPARVGHPPLASTHGRVEQITQCAPIELQQVLLELAAALPGVRIAPSHICTPGSHGCRLAPSLATGPARAFFSETEFGHVHPSYDGSLHLLLPIRLAERVLAAGWGTAAEPDGSVLVYGPRDEAELETVWQLLVAAYNHAAPGRTATPREGTQRHADQDRPDQ